MTSSFIRSVSCLGLQNSLKIYYRNLLTVPNLPEVTEVTSREVTEHHSHWLGDLQPWLHGDQRAIHLQLCHAGMARDLTNEMATAVLVAFKASSHQSAMRSTFGKCWSSSPSSALRASKLNHFPHSLFPPVP
jgi:hypothetical protein